MGWHVRRIRAGEGDRLREIRLRALRDEPTAFASTFEAEAVRTPAAWADAARARSAGLDATTFVAETGRDWIGLIGAYRTGEQPGVVELVSMWVEPGSRGLGVAQSLIGTVVAWARCTGAAVVGLWVTRGNDAAMAAYQRAGFRLTGDQQPLPSDPRRHELRMAYAMKDKEQNGFREES